MINIDTPSSNFIIHFPDDKDINLKSDQFNLKEVSIQGQTFLFLSLITDNLLVSKDISQIFQIDIQNIIPLGPRNTNKFDRQFFITGYSPNDFKFNEYKAFLQQICPKIQIFDNISVIEANTDYCQEEDIDRLSTFLPILYPSLNFTSHIPNKCVRIFISNRKNCFYNISRSDILSSLKWENIVSQIYFNSGKSIADVVLNEEGEKNYKRLFKERVISTDDYTFTICKFANISKMNKCKSLELRVEYFPSSFSLEKAYQLFSRYQHIYRIQLFNDNDNNKKFVIIQFTSQRHYKLLLQQRTIIYQSKIATIKPNREKTDESNSKSGDDEYEAIIRSEVIDSKNNRQVSLLERRKFIDDNGDEEISRENSLDDNKLNEQSHFTSLHQTRSFISDVDDDDDASSDSSSSNIVITSSMNDLSTNLIDGKSEVKERGISLHLVKEINTKYRRRRNHLFISDSYSDNNDLDDNDNRKTVAINNNNNDECDDEGGILLSSSSNRKFFSSSRFSNSNLIVSKSGNIEEIKEKTVFVDQPKFVQEIVESLSNSSQNKKLNSSSSSTILSHKTNPKNNRLYISDEGDFENDESMSNIDHNSHERILKRKFVIIERDIEDVGDYSYSEVYTEYDSCSDSE